MGFLLGFVSLVAVLQGMAWLGPRRRAQRLLPGMGLTVVGIGGLGSSLLLALVPGFFG